MITITLTITLINQYGVWQSSDLRLTNPQTRKLEDDYSSKHISFWCSDGAILLTYGGVGKVKGVPISDWICEFTRGETLTVDATLIKIRQRATEDLGAILLDRGLKHMFSIGAFVVGTPLVVQIRNFLVEGSVAGPVQCEFHTLAQRVPAESGLIVPWPQFVSKPDLSLLHQVSSKRPRKPKEFCDLLGKINSRVALSALSFGLVSSHCISGYMPPTGDGMQHYVYNAPTGARTIYSPVVLFGIDLTDRARSMIDSMRAQIAGVEQSPRTHHDMTQQAQNSITPKNRLNK